MHVVLVRLRLPKFTSLISSNIAVMSEDAEHTEGGSGRKRQRSASRKSKGES